MSHEFKIKSGLQILNTHSISGISNEASIFNTYDSSSLATVNATKLYIDSQLAETPYIYNFTSSNWQWDVTLGSYILDIPSSQHNVADNKYLGVTIYESAVTTDYVIPSYFVENNGDITIYADASYAGYTIITNFIGTSQNIDSSGGHTIKSNDSIANQRAALNFMTNGYSTIMTDSAVPNETRISMRFDSLVDVDPSGRLDGYVWGWNTLLNKTVPINPIIFTNYSNVVEGNITNDTQLNTTVPAGYKIDTIVVNEEAGWSAGNISIGTSSGGSQIVSAFSVSANKDDEMPLIKSYFSSANSTNLFISSTAWDTSTNVTLYFLLKKVL